MRNTDWQSTDYTSCCNKEIGWIGVHGNNGVCPHCGHSHTVYVNTRKKIWRWRRNDTPWIYCLIGKKLYFKEWRS